MLTLPRFSACLVDESMCLHFIKERTVVTITGASVWFAVTVVLTVSVLSIILVIHRRHRSTYRKYSTIKYFSCVHISRFLPHCLLCLCLANHHTGIEMELKEKETEKLKVLFCSATNQQSQDGDDCYDPKTQK